MGKRGMFGERRQYKKRVSYDKARSTLLHVLKVSGFRIPRESREEFKLENRSA
jgi:hypothetical protein